jgi:hypothetical protein
LFISTIIRIFAENYNEYLMKIEDIVPYLPLNEPFTKEVIRNIFEKNGENLTEENLNVRINRLKSKGVIINVSRGWYKRNDKKTFEPEITPMLKKLSGKLKKGFPFLHYILWSSHWLNDLTTLQLLRNIFVIEVESGSEDAVFRTIKEDFPARTFLNPKENEWENYMHEKENIVVKTMISESPYKTFHAIKIVRLEKNLVDLYCDKFWKTLFSSEMYNIYTEVCSNYSINYSTLLSYASRRGKREEIWSYIKSLDVLDSYTIEMMEK